MNASGEAVDQVVKISLEGTEFAVKIAGAGAKQVAALLYAILKDQKRTKGKTRLNTMLRSGKELKIFAIKTEDLQAFCGAAKKYGILYCVLKDKNLEDGLSDIMVRAEDAGKVNRIFERLSLATVDVASIKSEVEKELVKEEKTPPQSPVPEKSREDRFLDELMKPVPAKEELQNPPEARSAKSRPSEPTLEPREKTAGGTSDRPSVRKELKEIKAEQKEKADVKAPVPNMQHNPPKKKRKNRKEL